MSSNTNLRLIKTAADSPAVWMHEAQIAELVQNRVGFMDVTESGEEIAPKHSGPGMICPNGNAAIPTELKHSDEVHSIIQGLKKD
jgi:hypothetical protein